MKKIIAASAAILIFFTSGIFVFAGSIPEDLMHADFARVFFAEIISYDDNGGEYPEAEYLITKKIKGDVEVGETEKAYRPNFVGDFDVKIGKQYLFAYFDENNDTDIFEVTSTDTAELKLKNITGDMWERFEKYLNEGKYEEAETQRRSGMNYEDAETLAEVFMVDKENIRELTVIYRGAQMTEYQINKDDFFAVAEEIKLTQNPKIATKKEKNGVTIVAADEQGNKYSVWLDKGGKVGNSALETSSAVTTRFEMSREDYLRVCDYLPEELNGQSGHLKVVVSIAAILAAAVIIFLLRKKLKIKN